MSNSGHYSRKHQQRLIASEARTRRLQRGAKKLANKILRKQNPPNRWFVRADGTKTPTPEGDQA